MTSSGPRPDPTRSDSSRPDPGASDRIASDPAAAAASPSTRFGRRRLVAGLGAVGAAAVGGGSLASAVSRIGSGGARLSQRADRLGSTTIGQGYRDDTLYVALYGHPGSRTLGVMGEQGPEAAADRAIAVAAQYAPLSDRVSAAFEIITTVASSSAGSDGDYSNEFSDSLFLPWIDVATRRGMHVVLDLQSGRSTFPSQAREIESLLTFPNVSLAIDPEWRVGNDERPGGGRIGSVDGTEVNATVDYLDDLIRREDLPRKMLVVHQFTPSMVTNKQIIRSTPRVRVVFQMDGFGTFELKLGSWRRTVDDLPPGVTAGWKNFYDEDSPTPTPARTMSVSPTPVYVSYQ